MKKILIALSLILATATAATAWDAQQWQYQQQQRQYQQQQLEIQRQQLDEQRRANRLQEQQYYNDQTNRREQSQPFNYRIDTPNLLDEFNKGREKARRGR